MQLTINIGDINDNSPVCPSRRDIHILNSTRPNTVITTYIVEDADIGVNGEVRYVLRNSPFGREVNVFTIHNSNGEISTIRSVSQMADTAVSMLTLLYFPLVYFQQGLYTTTP